MPAYQQARPAAAFIMSELPQYVSRKSVTLAAGNNLVVGAVLGKITATGKYAPYTPGASNGLETAAAILIYATNASAGDTTAQVIAMNANANAHELEWGTATDEEIASGIADLAEHGVKVIGG